MDLYVKKPYAPPCTALVPQGMHEGPRHKMHVIARHKMHVDNHRAQALPVTRCTRQIRVTSVKTGANCACAQSKKGVSQDARG